MKTILLMFIITCSTSFAKQKTEFLEFGLAKSDKREGKKTNFQVKIGGNFMRYSNTHEYNGTVLEIDPKDEKMGGTDLTLGYQISLYGPLTITINGTWFHYAKNKDDVDKGEEGAVDEFVQKTKTRNKVYGGGFGASLNYEFMATGFIWQPFVELGGGFGSSRFELDYERFLPGETETYQATMRDNFKYANSGIGLNLIAQNGIFSYIKVNYYQFLNVKRRIRGTEKTTNMGTTDPINNNGVSQAISDFGYASYSLGMGYTF